MVLRVTAEWGGWSGAPGYTNLHFAGTAAEVPNILTATRDFLAFLVPTYLPNGISIQVSADVNEYDDETGTLVAIHTGTAPTVITGAAAATYSAAAGACVSWTTADIAGGRLIRGRTFLVPLAPTNAFQNDGTLAAAFRTAALAAGQALIDSPTLFGVWHRPIAGAGGAFGLVTSVQVADKTAVLRSRRD